MAWVIKLGEGVLHALRQHLERQKLEREAAGERWQDFDLFFPSTVGTPLGTSNVRVNFNKVLKDAGLPRIRFHDLRQTAASIMLNHDIPLVVVSKILGHSKPSVTMDIYGHLMLGRQDEASELMDSGVTPIQVNLEVPHQELSEGKKYARRNFENSTTEHHKKKSELKKARSKSHIW